MILPNTYLQGEITLTFNDQATTALNKALKAAAGNIGAVNKALNGISWNNLNPQGLSSDLTQIADSYNKISNALRRFQQLQSRNINQIQLPQIDVSNFTATSQRIQDYTNLVNTAMNLANVNRRRLSRNIKLPDIVLPNITPDKVANLQRYVDLINHLAMSFQQLTSVAPAVNKQLAQTGSGIKNLNTQKPGDEWGQWFLNMAMWLPKQLIMASVWSGIYRTIGAINQQIREGIQMYAQLENGLGRALSTGLNQGQVKQSFTPEAQGGFEESRQKLKTIAGLQALLFTSTHKANVDQYTGALYELTSANIKLEDAMNMVQTSIKVSSAAEANIEQTTRSLAGIYNIYKDRITDAGTAREKFNKIGNVVLYTWAKEQMELSELNNALKYSANIANLMNIDYRVLITTIGHLNTQMLKGSTAGTGLRQMWNASAKNMDQLVDLFGEANVGLKDFASQSGRAFDPNKPVDFIAILGELRSQLMQGKKETDKMVFSANDLKKAFKTFDLRGSNVLLTLLNSYDSLKQKISDVMNLNEDYIDQYLKLREANPAAQFEILLKNVKALPAAFLLGITQTDNLSDALAKINEQFKYIILAVFRTGEVFSQVWSSAVIPFIEFGIGRIVDFINTIKDLTKILLYMNSMISGSKLIGNVIRGAVETVSKMPSGKGFMSGLMGAMGLGPANKEEADKLFADLWKGVDIDKFIQQGNYAEVLKKMEESFLGANEQVKQLDMGSKKFIADLQEMIKVASDLNGKLTTAGDIQGAINASTLEYEGIYDAIANAYSAKQIKNISEQLTLARQLTQAYKEVYDQQVKDYAYRDSTLKQQQTPQAMRGTLEKDIQDRKGAYKDQSENKEFQEQLKQYEELTKKRAEAVARQKELQGLFKKGILDQRYYNVTIKDITQSIGDLDVKLGKIPGNVKEYHSVLKDEKALKEYDAKLKRIEEIKVRLDALRAEDKKYRFMNITTLGMGNYDKALLNIKNEFDSLSKELTTLEKQVNQDSQKMTQALSDSINESIKANENSIDKLRQKLPGLIEQMRDAYKTAQESIFTELDYPGMTPEEKQEAKLKSQQKVRTDKIGNLIKDNEANQGNIRGQIDSLEMVRTGAAERKQFLEAQLAEEKGLYTKYNEWKIKAEQENAKELLQLHIKQSQDKANLDFQINKATMTKQQQAMFQIEHQYDSLLVHYAGNKQMEAKINKAIEGEKKDTALKMAEELNQQLQKLADDRLKIAQDLAEKELSLERKTNEEKIYAAGAAHIKRLSASGASDDTIQKALDKFNASMEGVGKQWDQKEAQFTMKQAKQEEANLNKHKTDLENSIKNIDARLANAQKTGNKSLIEELKKDRAGIVNEIERTRVDIVNAKIKYIDARKQLSQAQMELATTHVGEKGFVMRSTKKGLEQGNLPSDVFGGMQIGGNENIGMYLEGPGNIKSMDQINNLTNYNALDQIYKANNDTGAMKMVEDYNRDLKRQTTTPATKSITPSPSSMSPERARELDKLYAANGDTWATKAVNDYYRYGGSNTTQAEGAVGNDVLKEQESILKSIRNTRENIVIAAREEIKTEEKLFEKNKQRWGVNIGRGNANPHSIINNMSRAIVSTFAPNKMPTRSMYEDPRLWKHDNKLDTRLDHRIADSINITINDKKVAGKSVPAEVEMNLNTLADSIQRNKVSLLGR